MDTQAVVCVLFPFLISTYSPKMAESSAYLYAKGKELVQREKLETERKDDRRNKVLGRCKRMGSKRYWLCLDVSGDRHSSGTGAMAAKVTTDSRQQSSCLGQEVGRLVPTAVMVSVE